MTTVIEHETSTPVHPLEASPTDQLEQELISLEAGIGKLRAMQVERLREIDRRQVPLADGCRSLNEWIASRLDLTPETAGDLARLTRTDHPVLTSSMDAGDITFDRAITLTRIDSNPDPDPDQFAHLDLAGVRRQIARHRRITSLDEQRAVDARHLTIQPNLDHSGWRLWGTLPGHDGALVEQALTTRADTFPKPPVQVPSGHRQADALVSICQDSLDGDNTGESPGPMISVFVDVDLAAQNGGETGVSIAGGPQLGPNSLQRLLCDGTIEVNTTGTPLGVGRKSRVIPPRLRRWVLHRDGGCLIDGCTSRYRLQPHHIVPWSEGGVTDADNLATVCWYHHHIVIHHMGYRLDPDTPPQRRRFQTPTRHPPGGTDPP